MPLSLLPIYSSPHLSPSLFFPTPHLSFLCLPKLSNAPTPQFILCCRRNASFSARCGPGVPDGAQHGSGIEEDDEQQPMKASCDDDEEEEGQESLSSLELPERWDVLGLGQAMVIPFSFLLHLFIIIAVKLYEFAHPVYILFLYLRIVSCMFCVFCSLVRNGSIC